MSKQLKIQASSVSRILKCPGSCTLESKLPDRLRYFAFKDAADYGTLVHSAGEFRLKNPKRKFSSEVLSHPRAEDIMYTADYYAAAVRAGKIKNSELFIETKFRSEILGIDCVAKSDAFFIAKKALRKFDLKSGSWDYTESAGAQMDFAAHLYCYTFGLPDGFFLDSVTVQPNYYNDARRVVYSAPRTYNRADFELFILGIKKRQKEFNAGSHCKMCSAILTCKHVQKIIEEFSEMAKKETKENLNFKAIYEKRDAVIAFLDALDGYLKLELENGARIDGLYLEEYNGHREWNDTDEVIKKLKFLKDKIYKPRELKSPAQVEKIAGKENITGLYDSPRLKRVAIRVNNFDTFEA